MKKNTIIPLTRFGLCKTISDSACPNPPTFGSYVSAWSAFITSLTLAITVKPVGTFCVTDSPLFDSMIILVWPLSDVSIAVILPAAVDVNTVLLLFSPLG